MFNTSLLLCGRSKFSISTNVSSGGSVSISPQGKQYAGTLMTVTCSPSSAYQFSSISIVKQDGTTVSYTTVTSGSKYTFIMPSSNVTVNVNYSLIPTYSISLKASGGTIKASKTSGIRAGETITVYLSPNSYYVLSSLTSSPSVSFSGSGNTRTFKMPSSNVRVTATFVAQYNLVIRSGNYTSGPTSYYGYSKANNQGYIITNTTGRNIDTLRTSSNGRTMLIASGSFPSTVRRLDTNVSVTFNSNGAYPYNNLIYKSDGGSILYFHVS